MKRFMQLAFTITVVMAIGSVLLFGISAYHILADNKFNSFYQQLLFINMKVLLVWIAIFVIGSLITSMHEKKPLKRNSLSRRMLDRS